MGSALVSFYVTYLAYRNLKSVVPLLRPDELFDGRLADLDRSLFAGSDPADLLHSAARQRRLRATRCRASMSCSSSSSRSRSPSRSSSSRTCGPACSSPPRSRSTGRWPPRATSCSRRSGRSTPSRPTSRTSPCTGVSGLQDALLDQRTEFLRDPSASGAAQSIGAFASLHVSIFFTAALATHLLGLGRFVKIGVWVLFALTVVATIYFGWHYVLDDLAGLVIAVAALALARALTGLDLRTARRPLPARG